GYFFLVSDSKGPIPKDIWRIVPEDAWRKDTHYAVFPVELLKIPIKASVPKKGIILDPFMGIGSTIVAAIQFGRRGIGIDISRKYVEIAQARVDEVQS
ncbi:MAG: DNA methyltransferase, partial [Candidatus Thorarchaeota archaeon]